ncbi:DUF4926 domain-containing protein [Micromonospora echinospora]|uniref:DUF4926 domain-containing protein n=1 Tax=Micromonospora echinospora TaxID=1877 RepID=UPI0034140A97
MVDLHDLVELRDAVPEENLPAGAVGTVVHVFHPPGLAYEVEFADKDGRIISTVAVRPDEIEQVGTTGADGQSGSKVVAGLVVLRPGVDWTATGGLFDWTLEFLIARLTDREAAAHLQEVVDNNLGSLRLDDLSPEAQREIVTHLREGLVAAGEEHLPEAAHKSDVVAHLRELIAATYRFAS